ALFGAHDSGMQQGPLRLGLVGSEIPQPQFTTAISRSEPTFIGREGDRNDGDLMTDQHPLQLASQAVEQPHIAVGVVRGEAGDGNQPTGGTDVEGRNRPARSSRDWPPEGRRPDSLGTGGIVGAVQYPLIDRLVDPRSDEVIGLGDEPQLTDGPCRPVDIQEPARAIALLGSCSARDEAEDQEQPDTN
ncbi:unnamed protein product, partial [Durusdinium trenchii]